MGGSTFLELRLAAATPSESDRPSISIADISTVLY
jgi:hypothetical protein